MYNLPNLIHTQLRMTQHEIIIAQYIKRGYGRYYIQLNKSSLVIITRVFMCLRTCEKCRISSWTRHAYGNAISYITVYITVCVVIITTTNTITIINRSDWVVLTVEDNIIYIANIIHMTQRLIVCIYICSRRWLLYKRYSCTLIISSVINIINIIIIL